MRKIVLNLFLLIFSSTLFAQVPGDSLSFVKSRYKSPSLLTSFEKQLQTYSLNQQFNYGKQISNLFLGINQTFNSTIIKSNGTSIRDNAFFSLLGEYNLSENFATGVKTNYSIYSDDKQLAINNSSIFNSSAYLKYFPEKQFSITPFAGISRNEQIGIIDLGPIYGAEALLSRYNFNEFTLNSELKFQNEDIAPRKNTFRNIKFGINKSFEKSFSNHLLGLYSEQRKDFYFDTDSLTMEEFDIEKNIQSRTEKRYSIVDQLQILFPNSNFSLYLDGSINWRTIDRNTRYTSLSNITLSSFDTKIDELKMNLNGIVRYTSSFLHSNFRINIAQREENHKAKPIPGSSDIIFEDRNIQEKRKNNNGTQITLSSENVFYFSHKDIFRFSLFHRKFIYDTPSELNNDDRDELLSMLSLEYQRILTPFFNIYLGLNGSLSKTVYIFKERSANNNTLRVLKFFTGGDLRFKYFSSKNSAEVLANYTVYDFEDLTPNLKSFSFRQLALRDSSTLKLFRTTYLKLLGHLKFSEQGDFKWDKFSNNPFRFLDERFAETIIEHQYGNFSYGFGLRYFALFTYLYTEEGSKYMHSLYSSSAPLISIKYFAANSLSLNIKGWYEFINRENNTSSELVNLFIRMDWKL